MSSFAELFEQSIQDTQFRPGTIVIGTVVAIDTNYVIVNAGLKSESLIPVEQFQNDRGELEIQVDDKVEVVLEAIENGRGETILSREKAKRAAAWRDLQTAHDEAQTVTGFVSGRVKGGFTVDIGTLKGFLPGSLVDIRPVRDPSYLEGKDIEVKIIKMDQKRNNVVVSRRAVLQAEGKEERALLMEKMEEGQEVKGIVKNLTDYGAFVDLGGIDGLLHITDMSWKRVKHPNEVVNVGDELVVKILKFDRERNRVSLGLKQMGSDPWLEIANRYPQHTRLKGKVSNITDYGCFVEIEDGVEGLVHVSEMDWTNKNVNPNKLVDLGDEVEVMVLEIDEERRRISLGLKQCQSNPWSDFAAQHELNEKVTGKIKSITDFGIFIGLEGNIDGLVHLSDISWSKTGEEAIQDYAKGEELETVILSIDSARERISLGIKQLESNPLGQFQQDNKKGSLIKCKVVEIASKKVLVDIADGIQGVIKIADVAVEMVKDAHDYLTVDEEIDSIIIGFDNKNGLVNLSIKALQSEALKQGAGKKATPEAPIGTTLGDLFKEQLDK